MATAATKFRIDVSIHHLLQGSNGQKPRPVEPKGLTLPTPVFPQYVQKLNDPGPERPPEGNRKWGVRPIYRSGRGVAGRNLFRPHHSLQVIFRQGGGAPRFQQVRQGGETVRQPLFRCLFHGI
jgi:hypothetical protein